MAIIGTDSIGRPIRRAAIDIDRRIGEPLRRFLAFVARRRQQRADHRSLRALNDHMLKDIGVSRCDVERETRVRWFR